MLAKFIRSDMEPILKAWDEFAKTLISADDMDKSGLRDHAREMLLAIADDLESPQSDSEKTAKTKGYGSADVSASWAEIHGSDRQTSGFSVMETISEFRALRASVVSLWNKAKPMDTSQRLADLTRFHEAIDQAISESLQQYTIAKDMETRLFGAILRASPDPIYVLDLEGQFVFANKATADLFALKPKEIIGKTTSDLGFPFANDFQQNLKMVMAEQSTYRGKFEHTFASGVGEQFEYLLAPVLDEKKETEATVCIARDVTEQAIAAKKIWYNAHYDLLTGLPNRRLFLDRLEQEVKHAKRSGLLLAVLFMDLDGFKEINDSLGHSVGDQLLAAVAKRLTTSIREEDTVARLGGDEFTILLSGCKQQSEVALVAQTVVDALAEPFTIARQDINISVSIGVSFYRQDAMSPSALLQAADHAMYKAKSAGSNQVCFFKKTE